MKEQDDTLSCAVAPHRERNHATFEGYSATADATHKQPTNLKVAAAAVLERNLQRNRNATDQKNSATETEDTGGRVAQLRFTRDRNHATHMGPSRNINLKTPNRYLCPDTPSQSATTLQPKPSNGFSPIQSTTPGNDVALEKPLKPKPSNVCSAVALCEGGCGQSGTFAGKNTPKDEAEAPFVKVKANDH